MGPELGKESREETQGLFVESAKINLLGRAPKIGEYGNRGGDRQ